MDLSGRSWGATAVERLERYPCDDFAPPGAVRLYRAVDVAASPARTFRWLCQLSVAPYSYDLIDNWGRRSPRTLTPGAGDVEVGDRMLGVFEVMAVQDGRHLTMVLTRTGTRLFGPMSISYVVRPRPEGSRLLCVMQLGATGPLGDLRRRLLTVGDLVMMRRQLLTLRDLAQSSPDALSDAD